MNEVTVLVFFSFFNCKVVFVNVVDNYCFGIANSVCCLVFQNDNSFKELVDIHKTVWHTLHCLRREIVQRQLTKAVCTDNCQFFLGLLISQYF